MAPPAFGQDPECSAESFRVKWVSRTLPVVVPWPPFSEPGRRDQLDTVFRYGDL